MIFRILSATEQRARFREDARAPVLNEQMRPGPMRYPVDRYLDQSSKHFEMVNIIDDDIWNPEPALRPEDEIILRKLHDMLQSTADDLKQLTGELSKFHEPGVQVKSQPTLLDEEFNEKVHIEEVVNAKFHGYKIVEPPRPASYLKQGADKFVNERNNKNMHNSELINKLSKDNKAPTENKSVKIKNLGITRTKIMQINNEDQTSSRSQKLNNGKIVNNPPAVGYNEFCFTYNEPQIKNNPAEKLKVQDMPSINIRGELKQQKVLQLDIVPESNEITSQKTVKSNVSVISVCHGIPSTNKDVPTKSSKEITNVEENMQNLNTTSIRKVSKMSTCDSSGSTNNTSSDAKLKKATQKRIIASIRNSPKSNKKRIIKTKNESKKETENRPRLNLDEWKRKLNSVYSTTTSKIKTNQSHKIKPKGEQSKPKVTEYIPYSKLTIGGVTASDIEKEISHIPNKNDVPLSPIIDDILSRENSFHKDSPKGNKTRQRILSTSDENLLQEVLEIERSVSKTLSISAKQNVKGPKLQDLPSDRSKKSDVVNESYDDDFEDEKTDHSKLFENIELSIDNASENDHENEVDEIKSDSSNSNTICKEPASQSTPKNKKNKQANLSFKDSVDVFEYIHSVDTHDTATQSNVSNKITPKETQTSPLHTEKSNIQPIHNDLWSLDPRREVEKMFEMEKEIIKKLIIEEYGDLLEKNINKPSTSNELVNDNKKNTTAVQKNTQTSPAHVKSVMTSPTRTKTRTTSPYNLLVPVHQQTSPVIFVTDNDDDENDVKINVSHETDDISVNLSSPRFSLRLPQNSKEVLSKLEPSAHTSSKISIKRDNINNNKTFRKTTISSSSSVDADNSSTELSSLGEIKIKRRLKKRMPTESESSSNSTVSKYSIDLQTLSIKPLRSEGEISLGQTFNKKLSRHRVRSDGETSFGRK